MAPMNSQSVTDAISDARTTIVASLAIDMDFLPQRGAEDKPNSSARQEARSDGFDRLDLGDIMFEQRFDALLQGHGRGRAARAGAVHGEIDLAAAKAAIDDVAAVLRDRRTHSGFDQLADLGDDLGVGGILAI